MSPFDFSFLQSVFPEAEFFGPEVSELATPTIDTRILTSGQLFFACRGAQVDGHQFVRQALMQGACGVVISERELADSLAQEFPGKTVIVVSHVQESLIILASAWRKKLLLPVIGVTGSIGKTTTKETIAAVLRAVGKNVLASPGNNNSRLGAALALLSIRSSHDVAVLEMGISQKGEMRLLSELVQPDIAIITHIGISHGEGLGTRLQIAREKCAIISEQTHTAIVNGDQAILHTQSLPCLVVRVGTQAKNTLRARKISFRNGHGDFLLDDGKSSVHVIVPTMHKAHVRAALYALAVADVLKIPRDAVICALKNPLMVKGRFEQKLLKQGATLLINDAYNAAPESMKAALEAFEKISFNGPKIAVLGDMRELGRYQAAAHKKLGAYIAQASSLSQLIYVGSHSELVRAQLPAHLACVCFSTWRDAYAQVAEHVKSGSALLIKASNGVGLHELADQLCTEFYSE